MSTISTVGGSASGTGNYVTLSGTYAGVTVLFASSNDGASFSPATAVNLNGGGAHSQWTLTDNTSNRFDLSNLPAGATVKVTVLKRTSGTLTVSISSAVEGATQALAYAATMTPDPSLGTLVQITPTDTSAFTIAAPVVANSGQELTFEVTNSSGGSMGTITWNSVYALAGAFVNPANGKKRTITFRFDSAKWTEICRSAADI
jgi:hypothetical protein